IDTGCCVGGGLTAVIIDKNRIIDVIQVPTQSIDIE
ncbi:MAG: diadenosine tetraphosphatase, partial [Bacteroidia bacterium]|nr:diadenosine tetraphosphatase [Bacteroidia bacterium]